MSQSPISQIMSPLTRRQCTSKYIKSSRMFKTLLPITSSTFLHIKKILFISLITQSSTSRHSYRLTTSILYLQPPQSVGFLLHINENISFLILYKKGVLPPLPLPLYMHPLQAVLLAWTPWTLKQPCKIPLRKPPIISLHIHLKIQMKNLLQFQILHQLNLP